MTTPRNLSILADAVNTSGVLGVSGGGTGLSAFTAGNLVYASGTTTLGSLALGTNLSITSGTLNASGGSGGGNVSNVGTPTSGQIAQWTSSTTIQGVSTTGTLGSVVLSNAPVFASYIDNTSIAAPSYVEGRLWYDSTQKALTYYNDVNNNAVTIGQETQVKVKNGTGSTINAGIAVYVTSTSSGQIYPNVAPAQANAVSTSAVLGLTTASISAGAIGYVTTSGLLTPVSTGSFTVGDILYLSPYSAGQLQNTVPPTGYPVQIGVVAYSNTPNGSIYVKQTTPLTIAAATLTGTVSPANGGTGVANNSASTLTISGAYPMTLTVSASTSLTLPTSGTVTALGNTTTGSGSIVLASSPVLVTPTLGAATATSVNGLTITSTTGVLTVASGKTLTASNSLAFAGTDGSTLNVGTGGTLAALAFLSAAPAGTLTGSTLASGVTTSSLTSVGTLGSLNVSGNVGIGTSTPTTLLQIVSAADPVLTITAASSGSAWLSLNGISAAVVHNPNNVPTLFSTNGTERMQISAAGNVGIGTSSPSFLLQVAGIGYFNTAIGINQDPTNWYSFTPLLVAAKAQNAETIIGIGNGTSGTSAATTFKMIGGTAYSTVDMRLVDNNGSPYFTNDYGFGVNYAKWGFSGTERMRITAAGSVGIGTSSPGTGTILDVQSTTAGVRFPNMTTTQKTAFTPAAGTVVFDTTLAKLCLYTGAAWQTITSA